MQIESYIVHQIKNTTQSGGVFYLVWYSDIGLEEGGDGCAVANKVSGGHFFSSEKSPIAMQTQSFGCGCIAISIVVEGSSPTVKHLYCGMIT